MQKTLITLIVLTFISFVIGILSEDYMFLKIGFSFALLLLMLTMINFILEINK